MHSGSCVFLKVQTLDRTLNTRGQTYQMCPFVVCLSCNVISIQKTLATKPHLVSRLHRKNLFLHVLNKDVHCTVMPVLSFFTEFLLLADTQPDRVMDTSDSPQTSAFPGDWPVTHCVVTDHS